MPYTTYRFDQDSQLNETEHYQLLDIEFNIGIIETYDNLFIENNDIKVYSYENVMVCELT